MTAEPSSSLSLSLSLVLTFFSPHFFSPARLKAATHEAEAVRRDQTVWERKVGELQAHCSALEDQKYEALAKVRESVQLAEEAALQKDQVTVAAVWRRSAQLKYVFSPSTSELFFPLTCGAACFFYFYPRWPQALLREKQKMEELEKTKEAIRQLIQEAAVRTRKEVM